ncbi:MAG: hypothetical protein IBJ04_09525 [Hydrogenophaga sp.]|uniref:hypothetical protein n=1 Tax=Hydrogenophaga sp. TaxID=1904254 RepID=UPI002579B8FA|nr:hypothetical protein [Hydrogenophaga sp.]MBL0944551.1 hypothetical protein [Hydrogenophaga sp.]
MDIVKENKKESLFFALLLLIIVAATTKEGFHWDKGYLLVSAAMLGFALLAVVLAEDPPDSYEQRVISRFIILLQGVFSFLGLSVLFVAATVSDATSAADALRKIANALDGSPPAFWASAMSNLLAFGIKVEAYRTAKRSEEALAEGRADIRSIVVILKTRWLEVWSNEGKTA